MRFVRVAVLTAGLAGATAGGAAAQQGGGGGGGGGAGAGGFPAGGGGAATTTTTSTAGGGTAASTTSTTSSSDSGASLGSVDTGLAATPAITGASIQGISSSAPAAGGVLDRSNFLGGTYVNPYYLGLYSNPTGQAGGFGTPLFGTTGGTATTGRTATTGGTAAGRATTGATGGTGNPFGTSGSPFGTGGTTGRAATAAAGRAGQFGAAGGFGGAATSPFGGQVIPLPRNIAYQAVLRFPAPAVAPAERLADVQAVVARSSMMANPAGVTVVQYGTAFVLRGRVASEDEARLAEGMVRLTPGVREVRNELTYPVQ